LPTCDYLEEYLSTSAHPAGPHPHPIKKA